jgi:enolase
MAVIANLLPREILDTRGNPTVEVDVVLDSGAERPRGCRVRNFDGWA